MNSNGRKRKHDEEVIHDPKMSHIECAEFIDLDLNHEHENDDVFIVTEEILNVERDIDEELLHCYYDDDCLPTDYLDLCLNDDEVFPDDLSSSETNDSVTDIENRDEYVLNFPSQLETINVDDDNVPMIFDHNITESFRNVQNADTTTTSNHNVVICIDDSDEPDDNGHVNEEDSIDFEQYLAKSNPFLASTLNSVIYLLDFEQSRLKFLFPDYCLELFENIKIELIRRLKLEILHPTKTQPLLMGSDILSVIGPKAWLNESAVDNYLKLIEIRSQGSVYCFKTCHYLKYVLGGYSNVSRFVKLDVLELFTKDYFYVPLCIDNHWVLFEINLKMRILTIFDSLKSSREAKYLEVNDINVIRSKGFLTYLYEHEKYEKNLDYSVSDIKNWVESWRIINSVGPTQNNTDDCGIFVCTSAEILSNLKPNMDPIEKSNYLISTFGQSDICLLRQRIAYELMQNKLMF